MSDFSKLTNLSDYIAQKNSHQRALWRTYQASLTQAVIHSDKKINHDFRCGEDGAVYFRLFNHFLIRINSGETFYSQQIIYSLNISPDDEEMNFEPFACARLSDDGRVDGIVDIRNKASVLDHYLGKISIIYQCIFDAMENNQPVHAALGKLLRHCASGSEKQQGIAHS